MPAELPADAQVEVAADLHRADTAVREQVVLDRAVGLRSAVLRRVLGARAEEDGENRGRSGRASS